MAWTTADRDAIKSAIAKGEQSVSFADRTVVYRSISDMIQALGMIDAEIASTASPSRPKQFTAYSSKGF
jgi:hypothetical protein